MFEPTPEFDSDLEWMLQSGQASSGMLLEALIYEFYTPIYRLALALLDDYPAAREAARETFATAILNLYRYRSQIGAQNWLYSIALAMINKKLAWLKRQRTLKASLPLPSEADDFGASTPETELDASLWLAIDELDEPSRLILMFHYLLGWQAEETGQVLKFSKEEVNAHLKDLHDALADAAGLAKGESEEPAPAAPPTESLLHRVEKNRQGEASIDPILKRSLNNRWPLAEISDAELNEIITGISKQVGNKGVRRRGVAHFKEVTFISIAVLVAIVTIWASNLVSPDPAATPPAALTRIVTKMIILEVTATPQGMPIFVPTLTPNQTFNMVMVQPSDTLASIAARTHSSETALRQLNRIPLNVGVHTNQMLLIPGINEPSRPVPTPFSHKAWLPPLQAPFDSRKILDRIAGPDLFDYPLWMDLLIIDNGPQSYIGPPKVQRAQVWSSKSQSLALLGTPPEYLQVVLLRTDNHTYLAKPSQGELWFSEWRQDQPDVMNSLTTFMLGLVDSRGISQNSDLIPTGREQTAGRDALAVKQLNNDGKLVSRFWLDDQTGLILRRITYTAPGSDLVEKEEYLLDVAYGIRIPQDLLNPNLPWRGGFAQNYDGQPIYSDNTKFPVLPERTRLPNQQRANAIDPAKSQLSFQYPSRADDLISAQVDLFANGYSLGATTFGNPWTTICQRSPDGRLIAYVSQPSKGGTYEPGLRWFNLTDSPSTVHKPLTEVAVTQFAFAPDSQRLAVFGYKDANSLGTLYLVDTATDTVQALYQLSEAKSLVWSPDGKYLAFIARYQSQDYHDNVVVIDMNTDQIAYFAGIDLENHVSQNWPMSQWGVEFPVEMGGMDACAAPPK